MRNLVRSNTTTSESHRQLEGKLDNFFYTRPLSSSLVLPRPHSSSLVLPRPPSSSLILTRPRSSSLVLYSITVLSANINVLSSSSSVRSFSIMYALIMWSHIALVCAHSERKLFDEIYHIFKAGKRVRLKTSKAHNSKLDMHQVYSVRTFVTLSYHVVCYESL